VSSQPIATCPKRQHGDRTDANGIAMLTVDTQKLNKVSVTVFAPNYKIYECVDCIDVAYPPDIPTDEDPVDSQTDIDVFANLMKTSPLKLAGCYTEENKDYLRYVGSEIQDNDRMEVTLIYEVFEDEKLVKKIEEKSFVGIISKVRILQLLRECNFEVTNVFSSYDFTPSEEEISNE